MRRYEFQIWLCGYGETEEEAWQDAYESFVDDPGSPSNDANETKYEEIDYNPIT